MGFRLAVLCLAVTACDPLVTVYACKEGTVRFYDPESIYTTASATREVPGFGGCRAEAPLTAGGRVDYFRSDHWESSNGLPGLVFNYHLTIDGVMPGDFLDLTDEKRDLRSADLGERFGCTSRRPEQTATGWDDPRADQVDARIIHCYTGDVMNGGTDTILVDGSTSTTVPYCSLRGVIVIECPDADYDDIREIVVRGMQGIFSD